jgi:hypothetical protein
MFAGVQRAILFSNLRIKLNFKAKPNLLKHVFKSLLQFELVKWFGAIPMKGDARFAPGMKKRFLAVADVYSSIQMI